MARFPSHKDPAFMDWMIANLPLARHMRMRMINAVHTALAAGTRINDQASVDAYMKTALVSHAEILVSAINYYACYMADRPKEVAVILPKIQTAAELRYAPKERVALTQDWQVSGFLWLLLQMYPPFTHEQLCALDRRQHLTVPKWTSSMPARMTRSILVPNLAGGPPEWEVQVSVDPAATQSYYVDCWMDYFRTALIRMIPSGGMTLTQPLFANEFGVPATLEMWRHWRSMVPEHQRQLTLRRNDQRGALTWRVLGSVSMGATSGR